MTKLEELKEEARIDLINASDHLHSLVTHILAAPNKEFVHTPFGDFLFEKTIKELAQAYDTQKEYYSSTFKPTTGIKGKKINN